MAERLSFTLDGRDNLTRVLNNAGDSAERLGQRIDESMTRGDESVQRFTRDASGRLRDLNGRFVSTSDAARLMGGETAGLSPILQNVASSAAGATSKLGGTGGAGMSGALGAIAAVVVLSLLPALGALVPMMAGVGVAAGTLALGFKGVGEAAALAGGDKKKYAEALKKLSPEARAFTKALVGMKGQFTALAPQIQKAMLPGFTQALKDAKPAVTILGKAMTEMGKGFGDAARGAGRMMKDSGFQKDFAATLKLGNVFVRDLTKSMGPFIRSLLDFGAASGPTLKAFSDGISGLLAKGLPGMFEGLKTGVKGSAAFLDGLFDGINELLPAIGRFSGAVANAFGSLFGELFRFQGAFGAGFLDGATKALTALRPILKDVGFGFKAMHQLMVIIGPTIKELGKAIFTALIPAGIEVDKMRGPFQRLSEAIERNKGAIQEGARIFANVVIDMVSTALEYLPKVVGMFRVMSTGVLVALGVIVSGAVKAFGWVPGIGDKLRGAEREFGKFKDTFVRGLQTAEQKTRDFAQATLPRLQQNKLRLNIDNWTQQIATAKAKLSDKNLPPGKRAKLTADIKDLQAKIAQAKREMDRLDGKTSTTYVKTVFLTKHGTVGHPKGSGGRERATGGPVSGPGTATSDSIPMWLSDGEYVIRASSVAKYGMGLMDALNSGRLETAALATSTAAAPRRAAPGLAASPSGRTSVTNNYITVQGAIDPVGTAKSVERVLLKLQRTSGN
ncbi:hypothetical protein [Streptomyces sp. NPDC056463]|uniref:hypothetical protein n=1 Tax=Streptomyces sp. NPDC056463 TaxID=3345827 RepID=UPI0036B6B58A